MLNFLLAIIIDAYTSVKDDIQVLSARVVLDGPYSRLGAITCFISKRFYGSEQPMEQPERHTTRPARGG
jgi:hypothetical protein